jgi:hypothetical protein
MLNIQPPTGQRTGNLGVVAGCWLAEECRVDEWRELNVGLQLDVGWELNVGWDVGWDVGWVLDVGWEVVKLQPPEEFRIREGIMGSVSAKDTWAGRLVVTCVCVEAAVAGKSDTIVGLTLDTFAGLNAELETTIAAVAGAGEKAGEKAGAAVENVP